MKLPLDERVFQARSAVVDRMLTNAWSCQYWSRDEQMFASAEGWCLTVYGEREQITCVAKLMGLEQIFATDLEALAYVLKRAEEGSPLHCRALVLHMADKLKNGE